MGGKSAGKKKYNYDVLTTAGNCTKASFIDNPKGNNEKKSSHLR